MENRLSIGIPGLHVHQQRIRVTFLTSTVAFAILISMMTAITMCEVD